jgi:hypothetical protein
MKLEDLLRYAWENPRIRSIKGTTFHYLWNFDYISDAKSTARSLRRRGMSATIVPETRVTGTKIVTSGRGKKFLQDTHKVIYEVWFREWGTPGLETQGREWHCE